MSEIVPTSGGSHRKKSASPAEIARRKKIWAKFPELQKKFELEEAQDKNEAESLLEGINNK